MSVPPGLGCAAAAGAGADVADAPPRPGSLAWVLPLAGWSAPPKALARRPQAVSWRLLRAGRAAPRVDPFVRRSTACPPSHARDQGTPWAGRRHDLAWAGIVGTAVAVRNRHVQRPVSLATSRAAPALRCTMVKYEMPQHSRTAYMRSAIAASGPMKVPGAARYCVNALRRLVRGRPVGAAPTQRALRYRARILVGDRCSCAPLRISSCPTPRTGRRAQDRQLHICLVGTAEDAEADDVGVLSRQPDHARLRDPHQQRRMRLLHRPRARLEAVDVKVLAVETNTVPGSTAPSAPGRIPRSGAPAHRAGRTRCPSSGTPARSSRCRSQARRVRRSARRAPPTRRRRPLDDAGRSSSPATPAAVSSSRTRPASAPASARPGRRCRRRTAPDGRSRSASSSPSSRPGAPTPATRAGCWDRP